MERQHWIFGLPELEVASSTLTKAWQPDSSLKWLLDVKGTPFALELRGTFDGDLFCALGKRDHDALSFDC